MNKLLPLLFGLALSTPGFLTAGEVIEKTYFNSRGEPVQIKVFSPSTRGSSSSYRAPRTYRPSTSRTSSTQRTIIYGGYHPSSYVPYAYPSSYGYRSGYSYGSAVSHRNCRVPYRPSISIRGTSSRAAYGIRLGR